MANIPLVVATVSVTAKDINNNNVLKKFNDVRALNFNYDKGMFNVVDATGSFYFPLASPLATVTYTIVVGVNGQHTVVMS